MQNDESYIKLRLLFIGHPHVDVHGLWCPRRGLTKLRNQFLERYERLPDGTIEQVHLLPSADLTYEIHETHNREQLTWYAATMEDSQQLYRISQQGAEAFAKRAMTMRQVIEKFPERPLFRVEQV